MKTIEEAANEFALCALMDYEAEKELNGEVDAEEFSGESFKAGVEFAQRWISVEEELPPLNIKVLAKIKDCKLEDYELEDFCFLTYRGDKNELVFISGWRKIELK